MVRLAERNARTTARDGTSVNRVKAAEERGRPFRAAGGVGDAGGIFGSGGCAGDPAVDVALHFRFGSYRHFERGFDEEESLGLRNRSRSRECGL